MHVTMTLRQDASVDDLTARTEAEDRGGTGVAGTGTG